MTAITTRDYQRGTVTVRHDIDAAPLDYMDDITLAAWISPGLRYQTDSTSDFSLGYALQRMAGEYNTEYENWADYPGIRERGRDRFDMMYVLADAVNRYAALAGYSERIYVWSYAGYSQGDWGYYFVESSQPADYVQAAHGLWADYMRGDVYTVDIDGIDVQESMGNITGYGLDTDRLADTVALEWGLGSPL